MVVLADSGRFGGKRGPQPKLHLAEAEMNERKSMAKCGEVTTRNDGHVENTGTEMTGGRGI